MYDLVATEPKTGAYVASEFGLPIETAIDHLRILEQFGVIRHRADDLGVVAWHYRPGNKWEIEDAPF